jgi:hypothetical protein
MCIKAKNCLLKPKCQILNVCYMKLQGLNYTLQKGLFMCTKIEENMMNQMVVGYERRQGQFYIKSHKILFYGKIGKRCLVETS